ncbi:spectrin binding protein [Aureococcus anophagefferens]|uniref:Spectrin binding protein n=1 Tax=Aureococcus anophagefferens TaxID=44056 RepID=A0ABR1G0D1_AURAN
MENDEGKGERMDDEERVFLDEMRAWYGSGEGRDLDATILLPHWHGEVPRLHHAARYGWCSAIRWLLEHGADVEVTTSGGATPLHFAAVYDRYDAAVLLLDAGACVDARDRSSYYTALHGAATNQQSVKLCKLLLSRGASLDALNASGQDPEAYARRVCAGGLNPNAADFLADVRAAGGWAAYVAEPRSQLRELRRELPALRASGRASPSSVRLYERLFSEVPEEIFIHAVEFWRSERDA